MTSPGRPRLDPVVTLRLARLGMLLGTLALGGVVWVLDRKGVLHPALTAKRVRLFRDLALVIWIAGSILLGATVLLRQRVANERRAETYAVAGWAIGEAVAIGGGVFYLLSSLSRFYVLGVVFFAVALLLTPIRRE